VEVRYDPRGQGLSGWPVKDGTAEKPMEEKLADDFKAVVDAYNLTNPFIATWYACRDTYDSHDTPNHLLQGWT